MPSGLSAADLKPLRIKGALDIPKAELRDALLESFALFVHPFLPVIDLADMYWRINTNGQAGTVSLMLFQVVMFAASGYIDMDVLKRSGYRSAREARLDFFNRVYQLYALDCEPDKIARLQTVVLMTLWSDNPDLITQTRNYIAVAMALAKDIIDDPHTQISPRLWKRIMWTCYTRDRILAFSFGKSTIFREDGFTLSPLRVEDFDIHSWPRSVDCESRHSGSPVWNSFSVLALAKLCIYLVELCQHIPCGLNSRAGVEALRCVKKLESWYCALPPDLHWSTGRLLRERNSRFNDSIMVHCAILNGIYLALNGKLCQSALACGDVSSPLKSELQRSIDQSSSRITNIFYKVDSNGLVELLPDTAVTMLSSAAALRHATTFDRCKSSKPSIPPSHIHIKILWKLKNVYVSAGVAFSAVAAEAQSHGLLTEVTTDAETRDEKNLSINQTLRQQNSHSNGNATAPVFLISDPKEGIDLADLGGGTTTSFLSSINLLSHEREFLIELSNG